MLDADTTATLIRTFVAQYATVETDDDPRADMLADMVTEVEKIHPGFTELLQVALDADADITRAAFDLHEDGTGETGPGAYAAQIEAAEQAGDFDLATLYRKRAIINGN